MRSPGLYVELEPCLPRRAHYSQNGMVWAYVGSDSDTKVCPNIRFVNRWDKVGGEVTLGNIAIGSG